MTLVRLISYLWTYHTYNPAGTVWRDPRPYHKLTLEEVVKFLRRHPYSSSIQVCRNEQWWAAIIDTLSILDSEVRAGNITTVLIGHERVYYVSKSSNNGRSTHDKP